MTLIFKYSQMTIRKINPVDKLSKLEFFLQFLTSVPNSDKIQLVEIQFSLLDQILTMSTTSTTNKGGKIDFDEVLKHIGPLGIYQYIQLFLLFLVTLSAGICVTVFVFTGFVPNYRCVVPQCESLDNATYYGTQMKTSQHTLSLWCANCYFQLGKLTNLCKIF